MNPEHIPYGSDSSQFFELWHPGQAVAGFAVFIHGGFWRAKYDLSHANAFCAALAARSIVTANVEYRSKTLWQEPELRANILAVRRS